MELLVKFIKKYVNILFGTGPVKVESFFTIFPNKTNAILDLDERYSCLLKFEPGKIIFYDEVNIDPSQNLHFHPTRYKNGGIFKTPDRYLFSLEAGCIFGTLGIIYDQVKRIAIDEATKDWFIPLKKNGLFTAFRINKPVYIDGVALSLCTVGSDGGFYHFLLEALPKLYLCEEIRHKIDYYIISGNKTDWKLKWLHRLGIREEQLIWQYGNAHYQFKQLLFTNKLNTDHQISSWSTDALRSLFKVDATEKKIDKVIYISRKNVLERELIWEDALLDKFPHIKKIDFSDMVPDETVKLMSEARYIIAPHGAGLANLAFANKGISVLELYPSEKNYFPCYQRLCNQMSIQHQVIWLDFQNPSSEYGIDFLKDRLEHFIKQS
ncbi:MAG: glycosyltransferase family 61 protein [Pedobacter sp.]|nr:MAG: glycosyltransferase family 61 protein [Pedobacter sp.]